MDPARAADQSWPDRNVPFRRPWRPPPQNRKRQGRPGVRNQTLNRKAYAVGRVVGAGGLDAGSAITELYRAARTAGLDHVEATATIRSGLQAGARRHA